MATRKILFTLFFSVMMVGACSTINPDKEEKHVSLLYIGDIHGQFEEHPEMFWPPNGGEEQTVEMAGGPRE